MKAKRPPTRNSAARLQRLAQARADEQARRIPWQKLHDTRQEYVDWQEFSLWVRSIVESEGVMPEWLGAIVEQRCPGFFEAGSGQTATTRPLALRLEDWIDERVFGCARLEGWFDAVAFYAVRDPRYQRAEVCWSECVKRWAQAKPIRYPSFEEWQKLAIACDETAHLVPSERKAQASAKLVEPSKLHDAVAHYIDWEALGYWARPALEHGASIPVRVREELERRCPGFLSRSVAAARSGTASLSWKTMMTWIADHFFFEARAEGWFDTILIGARRHPRAIRTMEYADHCDEVSGPDLPMPYPSFEDWRRDADAYVDTTPA